MKRKLYALAAAALLAATVTATANAGTSVDFRVSVGDPYRGATLAFRSEPDVVLVPDTKVYYVRDHDCDLYRYGRYWYFVEDGFWYRSAAWASHRASTRHASRFPVRPARGSRPDWGPAAWRAAGRSSLWLPERAGLGKPNPHHRRVSYEQEQSHYHGRRRARLP